MHHKLILFILISGLLFGTACSTKSTNDSAKTETSTSSDKEKAAEDSEIELSKNDSDKESITKRLKGKNKQAMESEKTLDEQIEEAEEMEMEEDF